MKKLSIVLTIAVFLLIGCGAVLAGWDDMPTLFNLSIGGITVPKGGTVTIQPNQTLLFDVDITATRSIFVSGDDRLVVGMSSAFENQTINGSTVHLFYEPNMQTLSVTADGVVDGTIYFQLQGNVQGGDGTPNVGPFASDSHPIHLQTGPVTDLFYLFVPKGMSLVNENGNKISSIRMEASRTRTLYAAADDYNQDGVIDALDYDVYPVNSLQMKPTIETDDEAVVTGTSTNPSLTGLTPTLSRYPTRIATVNLKAMNEGGDEGSDYPIRYTEVSYQIEFNGTTGSGINLQNILPDSGKTQTPKVSVAVTALDDAGGGSDGGGTCNAVGLGAFLFLVPLALFRRKSA